MGFLAGLLLYGILSARTPLQWTPPLWLLLAFVAVPVVIGLINGGAAKVPRDASRGMRIGLRSAGGAMFLYTGINLMLVHDRVGYSGDALGTFLVGLFVATLYALLAGIVAGAACAWNLRRRMKKAL